MKTRAINLYPPWDKYRGRYGKGFCGYCGKKLEGRRREWCSDECTTAIWRQGKYWQTIRRKFIRLHPECAMCHLPMPHDQSSYWIVDHIIPIALGGDEFDEANLQVLCPDCNKIKTAADMKQIALQRRNEKELERYLVDITEFHKVKKLYEFV
ncbi:MAG: HNH endonuclease [Candidatus Thorarchaeota archaeon]|jgi:5-methylcytosine-specific restriction endonuclease McrA